MSVQGDLLGIIKSGAAVPATTLLPLYEQLAPISVEQILGTWKGGRFDGGAGPDPIKWYGKRFVSRTHAEPLLCYAEDGSIYSYEKMGLAQLREMTWNGVTSAALIYDSQPIMDYFRKVTDDVIIGLGDIKGKPTDFLFHLTRT